jgi:hypothetical protein
VCPAECQRPVRRESLPALCLTWLALIAYFCF